MNLLGLVSEGSVSLSEFLVLLFSLSGIVWGYVLGLIAPEELAKGRKYFLLVKKILVSLILMVVDYYFYLENKYFHLAVFTIIIILIFVTDNIHYFNRSGYQKITELSAYLFIIIPYFLLSDSDFKLILACMIFLYGLVCGTLLKRSMEHD